MIKSGFFNSLDGDRKYDANDFSHLFDGIIAEGVFPNVGQSLQVMRDTVASMTVNVGTGRAYFMGHWLWNDDVLPLTIPDAHPTLKRIDGIILEVDQRDAYRACTIKVKQGTPAVVPDRIGLYEDAERIEILLAEITVDPGVTAIQASKIQNYIGTNYCPLVVGAVKNIDITTKLVQWEAEFQEWFDEVKGLLGEDAATSLAQQIQLIWSDIEALQASTVIYNITSGTAAPAGGENGDIYLRYV